MICYYHLLATQRLGSFILISSTLDSRNSSGFTADLWSPLALKGLVLDRQNIFATLMNDTRWDTKKAADNNLLFFFFF